MYLQQVEEVLIGLQFLSLLFTESFQALVFVQSHHVTQLLLILLSELLTVRHHLLQTDGWMDGQTEQTNAQSSRFTAGFADL